MAVKPYIDPLLTGVAVQSSRQGGFLAERILPTVNARKQTGNIARIDEAGEMLREKEDRVKKGGIAQLVDHDVDTTLTYDCVKHQLKKIVPWEDEDNADAEFAAHSDAVKELSDRIDLNKEIRLLSVLNTELTGGSYTATLAGSTQWSHDDSDPIKALMGYIKTVEDRGCARSGIRMALASGTIRTLMVHPDIRAVGGGVIRPEEEIGGLENMAARLASIFGLAEVLVATSVRNVASKGKTRSVEAAWGKQVLLFGAEAPSLTRTYNGLGMTVKWNTGKSSSARGAGGLMDGRRVQRWQDDDAEGEVIKVTDFYDQVITNIDAAFLIKDAVA